MRDINHHAEAIHLADNTLAEIVKAARSSNIIAARTSPASRNAPRGRHVAHAHLVVTLYILQSLVNRVAAFQSHQSRELSFSSNATNVWCCRRKLPSVGMFFYHLAHGCNLIVRATDCALALIAVKLRLDPDGEELSVQSTLFHANRI